ncbi:hypothetical protein DPMN_000198 [Dreissena polymorpha]|uniref:Uncharacterized protein n=1 Tax=Dreissena polymorpha TaxID=45954 RepID=A0A9D4RRG8_DREPO|nr:hypothetical protein DPMN_000198 [Dreissena polymorpha]
MTSLKESRFLSDAIKNHPSSRPPTKLAAFSNHNAEQMVCLLLNGNHPIFLTAHTVQPTRNKHIPQSAAARRNESMLSRPLKPRQYAAASEVAFRCKASHLSAETCRGKPRHDAESMRN